MCPDAGAMRLCAAALLLLLLLPCCCSASLLQGMDQARQLPSLLEEAARVTEDKGWFPPSGDHKGELETLTLDLRRLRAEEAPDPVFKLEAAELAFEWKSGPMNGPTGEVRRPGGKDARRSSCRHTKGRWCQGYPRPAEELAKPPPRGNKTCPNDCNGVGNCNYDIGLCDCPAGWQGDDCSKALKRPCTNRGRTEDSDDPNTTMGHIDAEGRDLDWQAGGWSASRCSGICDDKLATCWCDGKYRRILAPAGSPAGTPPVQRGRPLSEYCGKVKQDKDGRPVSWGNVPYDLIYGPNGWCESENPQHRCSCQMDGIHGRFCEERHEAICPNQCSGRGTCDLGFCKCHPGWYGLDCARKAAGLPIEPSDIESGRFPWLQRQGLGAESPAGAAAAAGNASGGRGELLVRWPRIYVYDVPPQYTTRMLQYRIFKDSCSWRVFTETNQTHFMGQWVYSAESYLHEMLLQSPHRTFDPDQADFFYVPIYVTCYFWPIIGWADYPWWYAVKVIRPMHGANIMMEVKSWLQGSFPYWNRRQGRDHIWLSTADEGACWMPTEIYQNSIILSHWGRMDLNHESNSAYAADNYSEPFSKPPYQMTDWREMYKGHACYTPGKDLIIPSFKPPSHYSASPLMGAEPLKRDILLFLKGDVGKRRFPMYSRGLRQKIHKLSIDRGWREKYRILVGTGEEIPGEYSQQLARSVFCLVLPGDGWSSRAEDAVLHGCIPVIIMDQVHAVFESILDYDAFSIRIKEEAVEDIPAVLRSIPEDKILRMQRRLARVWQRFAYGTGQVVQTSMQEQRDKHNNQHPAQGSPVPASYPFKRVHRFPVEDDAFNTIMKWLYSRITDTHNGEGLQSRDSAE